MDVQNRLYCQEDGSGLYGPTQTDQVYQRFTIFLTDEDENDLTIEESEDEKPDECDHQVDGPSGSNYTTCYNNNEIEVEKPKKRRGRKKKSELMREALQRNESDEVDGANEAEPENFDAEESSRKRRKSSFPCYHCSYVSSWKTNLEKHMMAQHTGERPFRCPHCDYASVHQFQLEKHWSSHHAGKAIHCQVCGFTTTGVDIFCKHLGHSHSGGKPHACPECGRRAVSLSALELHIFDKHSSITPTHKCPYCNYQTVLLDNLRNHVESLHKCSECNFRSDSLREVRRHRKKEHRIYTKNSRNKQFLSNDLRYNEPNKDNFENGVDSYQSHYTSGYPMGTLPSFDSYMTDQYLENQAPFMNKLPVIVSPSSSTGISPYNC